MAGDGCSRSDDEDVPCPAGRVDLPQCLPLEAFGRPVRLIKRWMPFGFEEFIVRTSPSIAPNGVEKDIYLVLEDFGRLGRAWRETDEDATDRETLILNLLSG